VKWYDQTANANTMTSPFVLPNTNIVALQNDTGVIYGGLASKGLSTVLQAPDVASLQNIWATGGFVSLLNRHVMTFAWNAATPATPATITLDGVVCGLASSATPAGTFASDAGQPLQLYNDNVIDTNNHSFGGYIYEALVYKSVPSAPNQTALISNIKSYYGIP
jgi:hypothetical protein